MAVMCVHVCPFCLPKISACVASVKLCARSSGFYCVSLPQLLIIHHSSSFSLLSLRNESHNEAINNYLWFAPIAHAYEPYGPCMWRSGASRFALYPGVPAMRHVSTTALRAFGRYYGNASRGLSRLAPLAYFCMDPRSLQSRC